MIHLRCIKGFAKKAEEKDYATGGQLDNSIFFSTQVSGKVLVYVKKVLVLDKTGNSRG